jgi:hypothetical protein
MIMKTPITIFLLLSGMAILAQPALETVYPVSTNICTLETTGDKYYTMDITNKQCRIYNMDHSLYRTIYLEVPEDYYLFDIQQISQHIFNHDDLIEFAYVYSKFNPTETSWYYSYETRVINESGTEILKVPGAGHTLVIPTQDGGRKFLVFIYDFYVIPATTQTQVYSLPDSPLKSEAVNGSAYRLGNPYPNPASGMINIPVSLPPGVNKGYLQIYNISGQLIDLREIKKTDESILIPGGSLLPGSYIYNISGKGQQSESKKITIQ